MTGNRDDGDSRARGPKLTRRQIVATALEIIDEEGVKALTMRELGKRLAVDPMAVYHHFENRQAVLDAAVGEMLAEVEVPPADLNPKERLKGLASALRSALLAHPNAVSLLPGMPMPMSTSALQALTAEFTALTQIGVSPDKLLAAHRLLIGFVINSTRADIERDSRMRATTSRPSGPRDAVHHGAMVLLESGLQLVHTQSANELFHLGLSACIAGIEATMAHSPA